MGASPGRWILAFDASCGTCREISKVVVKASTGKLEVLPLAQSDVKAWRQEVFGGDPPWRPTLINVKQRNVRAWTGVQMSIRLARHLGVKSTVNVLKSLGELKHRSETGQKADGLDLNGIGRKQFIKIAGGALLAGGFILTGKSPAFAVQENRKLDDWISANKDRLPTRYAEFSNYSLLHRRAIFVASSAEVKSSLWLEHLEHYRSSHENMSPDKMTVLNHGVSLLSDVATHAGPQKPSPALHAKLEDLRLAAIGAFGNEEAKLIFATLGPSSPKLADAGNCACSIDSDWCGGHCEFCCPAGYGYPNCTKECMADTPCCCVGLSIGCGNGWHYECNGVCFG